MRFFNVERTKKPSSNENDTEMVSLCKIQFGLKSEVNSFVGFYMELVLEVFLKMIEICTEK